VESVQDYAIFLIDPVGKILTWNLGAERIKGYTADEIVGQHFSRFYTEEDLGANVPAQHLERARREGRSEAEGWRIRRDGTRFWANVVITALFDEDGSLRGFGKVTRDLTERRERERARAESAAIARSERWLRATLNSIGDAVIVTDDQGLVMLINPVAAALTGWSEQEARGLSVEQVFRIVNEHSREPVESPIARVIREGVVVGLANHTILLARDGREIPIDDSGAPVRGEDERLNGVVMVFRDITDRRRAEREP
jgi:PAS domain S-box-containing protein